MYKQPGKNEGNVNGLDLTALRWFYPSSVLVSIAAFLLTGFLWNHTLASGILTGGIFGVINLGLIILLSVSVLDPVRRNPFIAFLVLGIKVPIAYGFLIALFTSGVIDLMGFAIGFQLFITTLIIYVITAQVMINRNQLRKGVDTSR